MSPRGLVIRLKRLEAQVSQAEAAVWVPPTFDDAYLPALLVELREHGLMSEDELQGLVAGAWHELELHEQGRRPPRRVLKNLNGAIVTLP